MDPRSLVPILLIALVIWSVVRRLRRTFGRQSVDRSRLTIRIGILTVLGAIMIFVSARDPILLGSLVVGVAGGAALGYLGLRQTVFEATPQGRFYTPHTYIGLLVTVLFLGRLLFRFVHSGMAAQAAMQPNQDPLAAYQRSPLTLATFGLLIGYYLVFNLGVLSDSRYSSQIESDTGHST